ncbi:uncharacterized protein LOC128159043 [Crassostrea angulata]|uniref:uncharacterized protein LOC128159043 n=1 Tax=Magallana angulata TaxID=2784310 RepID=UPI0022B0C9BC|nr:uncharacterized protein LOC128159043 [Crassostrea angulata]
MMLEARTVCVVILVLILPSVCYSLANITVSFDKDACFFSQRSVGADTIYHVTYDGTPIDPLLCSMMKFSGGDSSRINTYRVCVSLLHYEDPDCAIWFGYIIATDQIGVFNCTVMPPSPYCNKYTDVAFKIQIKSNTNANTTKNVKFRMKVYAELETDYVLILSASIGGGTGGLILLYITYKLYRYIQNKTKY